jgi:hypothetical protein
MEYRLGVKGLSLHPAKIEVILQYKMFGDNVFHFIFFKY